MDWIKVTPETMPPDMEPVFATVVDKYRTPQKSVWIMRNNNGVWESFVEDDYFTKVDEWVKVTHWAKWPEPAED